MHAWYAVHSSHAGSDTELENDQDAIENDIMSRVAEQASPKFQFLNFGAGCAVQKISESSDRSIMFFFWDALIDWSM